MVPLVSLWMPIVLSAVAVFVVSAIIHMVLPYHKNDIRQVPNEDGVMDAMRKFSIPPGDYGLPKPDSMKAMKSPEFQEKMKTGPVAFITVVPSGPQSMGTSLALWFVYSIIVGVFAGYIAGETLKHGTDYLKVFQIVGCVTFTGYSLALLQNSIWWKRGWGMTIKSMFDGLIYALITAGFFGWLWPK